jgi:hypothetical protein
MLVSFLLIFNHFVTVCWCCLFFDKGSINDLLTFDGVRVITCSKSFSSLFIFKIKSFVRTKVAVSGNWWGGVACIYFL